MDGWTYMGLKNHDAFLLGVSGLALERPRASPLLVSELSCNKDEAHPQPVSFPASTIGSRGAWGGIARPSPQLMAKD